jgi:hypothetical protein
MATRQRKQAQTAPHEQSGQPGDGAGRQDVTGIAPEGIHPDPNITEGHPGYQESGDSEITPPAGSVPESTRREGR